MGVSAMDVDPSKLSYPHIMHLLHLIVHANTFSHRSLLLTGELIKYAQTYVFPLIRGASGDLEIGPCGN